MSDKVLMHPVSLTSHRLYLQAAQTKSVIRQDMYRAAHICSLYSVQFCAAYVSSDVTGVTDILTKWPLSRKPHIHKADSALFINTHLAAPAEPV